MTTNNINSIHKINWVQLIVETTIFALLPPIIGLPLLFYRIFDQSHKATKTTYISFMVCIALYLGSINATKEPGGDQIQYFYAYKNVPIQGFIGSLINIYGIQYSWQETRTQISAEFMNGVYNYIGYYLTLGYYPLFAALITIANYIFNFLGIYKFSQTLKKPHIPIVCGVIILSFFYLYFQYLLQIQKQFLAQSIMMYILASYAVTGKLRLKEWILMGCAFFTHASTILFIPLILYKPIRDKLNKKNLIVLGAIFSLLIIWGPQLAGSISSENNATLTYGINRLASAEISNDGTSGLVLSQIFVIAIPMFFLTLNKLWLNRKTLNSPNAFILNVVLLLLLAIVAMYNQPVSQYRYFMMLIAFMPYTYFFISSNLKTRDTFLLCLAIIMIIWFFFQFEKIKWHYAPELDIIIKSPILLLIGKYY